MENNHGHQSLTKAVDFLLKVEEQDGYRLVARERGRAYVVSFSTKEDDLRQWQTYGRNNGVALGFSLELLAQTQPDAMLAPVVYGEVEDFSELLYEDMRVVSERCKSSDAEELRVLLIRRYALFLALMKSARFKDENEWRLVLTEAQVNRQSVTWRPGLRYAIPHLELALWKGAKLSKLDEREKVLEPKMVACSGCRVWLRRDAHPLTEHYYDSKVIPISKSQVTLRE